MEALFRTDQLLYFKNEEIGSTIGLIIDKKKTSMWFGDRDEIPTRTKVINNFKNYNDPQLEKYINVDKYLVWFGELTSTCMCASVGTEYLAIITNNNDHAHKATYKLHMFTISKVGIYTNNYLDSGVFYSYFA
jgi:hypothetical protein